MPTYKGRPISAAKARLLVRKGIKLDAPAEPARIVSADTAQAPRSTTPRASAQPRARATAKPLPSAPKLAPLGGTPSTFDISDAELERLTKPDTE